MIKSWFEHEIKTSQLHQHLFLADKRKELYKFNKNEHWTSISLSREHLNSEETCWPKFHRWAWNIDESTEVEVVNSRTGTQISEKNNLGQHLQARYECFSL